LWALLAPNKGNAKNLSGFDEYPDIVKQVFFIEHRLGELALDIDNYEATVFLLKHSFALICLPITQISRWV